MQSGQGAIMRHDMRPAAERPSKGVRILQAWLTNRCQPHMCDNVIAGDILIRDELHPGAVSCRRRFIHQQRIRALIV